jgi:hypothetical protein
MVRLLVAISRRRTPAIIFARRRFVVPVVSSIAIPSVIVLPSRRRSIAVPVSVSLVLVSIVVPVPLIVSSSIPPMRSPLVFVVPVVSAPRPESPAPASSLVRDALTESLSLHRFEMNKSINVTA